MKLQISEMTEREILRRQLELLAAESTNASDIDLWSLSSSMCEVIRNIERLDEKMAKGGKSSCLAK